MSAETILIIAGYGLLAELGDRLGRAEERRNDAIWHGYHARASLHSRDACWIRYLAREALRHIDSQPLRLEAMREFQRRADHAEGNARCETGLSRQTA